MTSDGVTMHDERPRVLVVGSGFAGFHCMRRLEKHLPAGAADLVVVSSADYLLYSPLLPNVAAGVVEPRHIAVGLHAALRRAKVAIGHVVGVDVPGRRATLLRPDGSTRELAWDRLVLAPGGVSRTFNVPGVADHALGLKTLAEATYLRDHVLRELDNADAADDPARRRACCTFVVVGAGYSGTETAAQMQLVTSRAAADYPRLRPDDMRWVLVDLAPRVLPELGRRLGDAAMEVLRRRGVEVRLGTTVEEATGDSVRLSDGETIPTHTLVWCAGVTPSPLISTLGLPTERGRLRVGANLQVPEAPDVFAFGDAAAVPDLTRPGQLTGQTAQHAQRQGRLAARNVAASLGFGKAVDYRHRDLGFAVDLGGFDAVASPFGVPLAGLPGLVATRGYHLLALPATGNRIRVSLDWLLDWAMRPQLAQLGFLREDQATMAAAEHTGIYPAPPADEWEAAARDVPTTRAMLTDQGLPRRSLPRRRSKQPD
ncbi:MAG TPA: NAD(P)/FAD-dependent oxidoreductase [Actinomycetes bacterium]|jgi:NADH dehydrogenase|nr:NAD(P)/FAD-dependent oxidoreductase [Actinomycetes bacterium]